MSIDTPWERARRRQRGSKPAHRRSEERGAAGGQLQVNSGRFWHSKRDFRKYFFVFENRQTDSKSIMINAPELKKITREAIFEDSLPGMRLDFTAQGEEWVLLRANDFQDFFEALKVMEGLIENYEREKREATTDSEIDED